MAFELEKPPIELGLWTRKLQDFLRHFYVVVNKTAAYTVPAYVYYVRGDATGAAFTVTLPEAKFHLGRKILIKKVDSSGNAVTVGVTGSDTIEGDATVALSAQWDSLHVIAGASGSWEIIA